MSPNMNKSSNTSPKRNISSASPKRQKTQINFDSENSSDIDLDIDIEIIPVAKEKSESESDEENTTVSVINEPQEIDNVEETKIHHDELTILYNLLLPPEQVNETQEEWSINSFVKELENNETNFSKA